MSAFYNEHDPKAAAWLRELITMGVIAPGIVDERSIADIQPHELNGYTQIHFFAGVGGWSLALRLAGVPDDEPVWTGSCPCQPFSAAGEGRGTDDERHLWPEFYRLICARNPRVVYGEQVASAAVIGSAASRSKRKRLEAAGPVWFDGISADLEAARYACAAVAIPAAGIGAPHIRLRLFWVAYSQRGELQAGRGGHHIETGAGLENRTHADGRSVERAGRLADRLEAGPAAAGSGAGRVGDTCSTGSGRHTGAVSGAEGAGERERLEPRRLADESVTAGDSGRLGDTDGRRCGIERQPQHGDIGRECGEVVDRSGAGRSGTREVERMGDATSGGRGEQRHEAERAGGAGPSAWGDYDIIPCRDGKFRRIERGTFPLIQSRRAQPAAQPVADGLSCGVVPSGDSSLPEAGSRPTLAEVQATAEARVMRLRGYGNAIVAQEAAEFILAAMEATA